jgi:hypothetical protein
MKEIKQYRVFQTISVFVEAKNEVEAVQKVREDENTYNGWDKWYTEEIEHNDIIDFYPPLEEK